MDEAVFDETVEGDSKFVSLDVNSGILAFENNDSSLQAKIFGVFIRAHIDVDPEI